ncbi:MAG TPA: SGNH/GDSL hydrolase family protein [Trebonia sp.]|jgi:lysophospholipase L1-like esterase|nr:SGNH/GDSL hydrolase family protein [Trebonia sp.]
MGDPVPGPGPRWRGWPALLAEGLREPGLYNLATAGAQTADVARDQLPRALALDPDVASVVVGTNDTLRASFNPGRIAEAVAHTVGTLRGHGTVVLTMRLPDPGRMFGLPDSLARPLARRIHAVNSVLDDVAASHGTLHFDAAGDPATYDRRMWAADRLHPNERGHRRIACCFHDLLAAAGFPVGPRPDPEPSNPPPTRRAEVTWLATRGLLWLMRRSTDLVPYLLAMAVREWWSGPEPVPALSAWSRGPGLQWPGPEGASREAEAPLRPLWN